MYHEDWEVNTFQKVLTNESQPVRVARLHSRPAGQHREHVAISDPEIYSEELRCFVASLSSQKLTVFRIHDLVCDCIAHLLVAIICMQRSAHAVWHHW